jgi:predicted methyltransferase
LKAEDFVVSRFWIATAAAAALLMGASVQAAPSAAVTAAVADSGRPDADKARDVNRKPAEVLDFAGVKPGQVVGELMPGGGYYTRILSKAVGPSGKVYALFPDALAKARPQMVDAVKAIGGNVVVILNNGSAQGAPEKFDLLWTSENYHDFHNAFGGNPPPNIALFNKAAFDSLKPGGTFIIEDHAAAADAGPDVTSKLHRINPAQVKTELAAAGFKLVAESDVLKVPSDPHTAPVFDASVRGKTDKLLMKFKRP